MKTNIVYLLLIFFVSHTLVFGSELIDGDAINTTEQTKKGDAVIINEDNVITIVGRKAAFINFSVTKKMKVEILTQAGLEKYSKIVLPETFDPTYIAHFPLDRNYTNVFSNIKFNSFEGTITTKDGKQTDAVIKSKIEPVRMVMLYDNFYGNFDKNTYQIENLKIGDVLEVVYNYSMMYAENYNQLSSFRIFFNGDLLKQNYTLTISHDENLNIDMEYVHEANPDSTYNIDNRKVYYWNKRNVYGCINEEGSRPYRSLPHLIFSVKPYELLYTIPYSFEERYIPFYSLFTYQREMNHLGIAKSILQGVNTKQYLQINKYIQSETQDITGDSLGYLKLLKIHNTIAENFDFDNDTGYFKKDDNREARMGEYLSRKTLRDISRYDLYVALLLKIDLVYFTAYLCDNRMGEISNAYFYPMYNSDYLFAVLLKNNSVQYLYPKKSRFGYYLNEVPFYFEDTKAQLVHIDDYRNYKKPISESTRKITLPNSTVKDNMRRNSALVDVSLEQMTAHFTTKINLYGQYSTLIRGLYQYNYQDETINKLYNKKIWEINDEVEVLNQDTEIVNKEFPFPAVINTDYVCNNLLETHSDTISLNLTNWFNHIIYTDFDTTRRQLDFYPDFRGKDSYVYFIQFDKNVHLISSVKKVKINNAFGELIIDVEQVNPNAIKLSSSFKTIGSKVEVNQLYAVQEIYNNIQTLNQSYLLFKLD